jgi:hypothetical protein
MVAILSNQRAVILDAVRAMYTAVATAPEQGSTSQRAAPRASSSVIPPSSSMRCPLARSSLSPGLVTRSPPA